MHLEMQFIDVNSCTGIESLLVDIWHVSVEFNYEFTKFAMSNYIIRSTPLELTRA